MHCTLRPSHRSSWFALHSFLTVALAVAPLAPLVAQGTAADYARAEGLRARYQHAILNAVDQVHWVDSTSRFWYRRTTRTGADYVVVDVSTQQKRPAFDQARLASGLAALLHHPVVGDSLPFVTFEFTDHERAIVASIGPTRVRCSLDSYTCANAEPDNERRFFAGVGGALYGSLPAEDTSGRASPDGKWIARIRNYNVYVAPAAGGEGFYLSTDGSEGNAYHERTLAWSPDSRHIAVYRIVPGYPREVHYVESSPESQLQPLYLSRYYSKPGDPVDRGWPVLFDVEARRQVNVSDSLFPNAYQMSPLDWRRDSRSVTFEYNQRGHQAYRVIEADAGTGRTRAVIDEESPTFFEYSAKKYRYDIDDGREIIWMSERDGWNHLYLYDGATGTVKNQITKGPWVVRGVDMVDTVKRQVWFHASGMDPKTDPYFVQYYRINFDGSGLVQLTHADAMHAVTYSPDMQYYVDVWSRVDLPPVAELHRASDDGLVMPLEKADATALYATGWKPPEVFVAKGRDGKTDIWGVIIRPTNFDPKRRYPVVENIYAGPQDSFVPKTFGTQLGMQQIAELGFIVVQIDGMGTSNRSKAFHDVAYKDLADAGFPDRILWHKAAAARYPYYDISRVGIYGTSAGGQSSTGALLFHPEFYKVAVSAAGSHDNRMDKLWWNEQWMGWPIGPEYAASSNVDNAWRLQGKLMLYVGEMDTNVDPSTTMQVVNALIKAHKYFDLLVIPGADHTSGGDYGDLKRWDYFVHNLLGVEPPNRNAGTAPGH
ncbi:MAG TPA: DPP IV N-terminal domain-containing protein [Gemmatimonadaceae bacterium]|nr:DPP IV N-terminal domain-containing protein [Gemmatimonadaceae bacterium]